MISRMSRSGFNLAANDLVISGSDAGSSYYNHGGAGWIAEGMIGARARHESDGSPKGYNTDGRSIERREFRNLANGTGDNRWAGALISLGSGFNLAADLVISGSDAGRVIKVVLGR